MLFCSCEVNRIVSQIIELSDIQSDIVSWLHYTPSWNVSNSNVMTFLHCALVCPIFDYLPTVSKPHWLVHINKTGGCAEEIYQPVRYRKRSGILERLLQSLNWSSVFWTWKNKDIWYIWCSCGRLWEDYWTIENC